MAQGIRIWRPEWRVEAKVDLNCIHWEESRLDVFAARKRILSYVVEGSKVVSGRGEREVKSETRRSRIEAERHVAGANGIKGGGG